MTAEDMASILAQARKQATTSVLIGATGAPQGSAGSVSQRRVTVRPSKQIFERELLLHPDLSLAMARHRIAVSGIRRQGEVPNQFYKWMDENCTGLYCVWEAHGDSGPVMIGFELEEDLVLYRLKHHASPA